MQRNRFHPLAVVLSVAASLYLLFFAFIPFLQSLLKEALLP